MLPLVPHLRGVKTFAEPCAGDGALIEHLESFGLRCVYQGDISSGQDALALNSYGDIDAIISNPPFRRELMHRLIAHFIRAAPLVWLLLESDWAQTRQAAPFMSSCSDIVAIGRVRWGWRNSKHTGKEYSLGSSRFNSRHRSGPVFHWRGQGDVIAGRAGRARCATSLTSRDVRPRATDACRQRAHRAADVTISVTEAGRS